MQTNTNTNVNNMLAQWEQQGRTIAETIEAERDTVVQRIERDRCYVHDLSQRLGEVGARLGLPPRAAEEAGEVPVRRKGGKMSRAAQMAVEVIRRRDPAALRPENFNSAPEVVFAVLARESDLAWPDIIKRCAPLRPSIKEGSWQAIISRLGVGGKLTSSGPRGRKKWRLAAAVNGVGSEEKGAA